MFNHYSLLFDSFYFSKLPQVPSQKIVTQVPPEIFYNVGKLYKL